MSGRNHSLADDEALARMLQSQEDSLASSTPSSRNERTEGRHRPTSTFGGTSNELAQMYSRNSRYSGEEISFINEEPAERLRTADINPMAYARQLQQEALSGIYQSTPQHILDSDMEIARIMQENEERELQGENTSYVQKTTRHHPSLSDEQLARYLESTGKSLRDLSPQELQQASAKLPSPAYSEIQLGFDSPPDTDSRRAASKAFSSDSNISLDDNAKQYQDIQVQPQPPLTPSQSRTDTISPTDLARAGLPSLTNFDDLITDTPKDRKKKKKLGFLNFKKKSSGDDKKLEAVGPPAIPPPDISLVPPSYIPPPPGGSMSAPPTTQLKPSIRCANCARIGGSFISALGKKYHEDCFLCQTCNQKIDRNYEFVASRGSNGEQVPHHKDCFSPKPKTAYSCKICSEIITRGSQSGTAFVRHPFFDDERICIKHVEDKSARRCTSCRRFEPWSSPFVDLEDCGRILCYSCLRSTIFDGNVVEELWGVILSFLQERLHLEVWDNLASLPILLVNEAEITRTKRRCQNPPPSHKMARGMCLIDEKLRPGPFRIPSYRYNHSSNSLEAIDQEKRGYTTIELENQLNGTSNASVILVLSGLPRDLTLSIMMHEAILAWIRLHPHKDKYAQTPEHIEQGCAILASYLLLKLGHPEASTEREGGGPSDADLRRYFRFCIESDESETFGESFRRAFESYKAIGMEELMNYVVAYNEFPSL